MTSFDLVVIGTGSGLEVSAEAAENGLSVAVVEEGPFGGTCLNRGCIPSKILIHCADVMETIRGADRFGIKAHVVGLDWQFIIRRAYEEIDADAQAIEQGNRQADNITVYKGTARFVGPKTLEVNGEQVSAETIVIAAGTRPSVPEIPGLQDVPYITSDGALRLPEQPRRLVIVGGGYIAAEMAHFFGALGTEVTIVHRGPTLLGCHIIGTDASMLVQEVANAMRLRLSTDAITQSIYVHPALPEVVQRAFGSLLR